MSRTTIALATFGAVAAITAVAALVMTACGGSGVDESASSNVTILPAPVRPERPEEATAK